MQFNQGGRAVLLTPSPNSRATAETQVFHSDFKCRPVASADTNCGTPRALQNTSRELSNETTPTTTTTI